jgi:hypothetical protein
MFGQSLLSAFGSAACTTDTDQLFTTDVQTTSVATYQLNNATTSIPSNTYPGTPSSITYAAGKFGNAAVFNGSSSKISIPSSFGIGNIASYSVSLWAKSNSNTTQEWIGGKTTRVTNNHNFTIGPYDASSQIRIFCGSDANDWVLSQTSSKFYDGLWHNYTFVKNGTYGYFYIDGVLFDSSNVFDSSTTLDPNGDEYIGAAWNGAPRFNGSIDQVRIFNTALPQSAVTALYNETTTTATYPYVEYEVANPNSIAYYKMSDATDQLGNYNGTASNVNFNTEGKFGFAGAFNGSSSYISLPFNLQNTAFSVSFWAKNTLDSNNYYIIANNSGSTQSGWHIGGANSGGTVYNFRINNGTNNYLLLNSGTVDDSNWHHVVVTWDNTTNANGAKIYINGSLSSQGTSTSTTNFSFTNSTTQLMREPNGSLRSDGNLDQIRIYDSALSAANVTTLYNEIECPEVEFLADYLVIAGGGGTTHGQGSGGGAGGYRTSYGTSGGGASAETILRLNKSVAYAVTVGAGGIGNTGSNQFLGGQGQDSIFSSITSAGGGGGTAQSVGYPNGPGGQLGGSGSGGARNNTSPGAGTPNQGFAGGAGNNSASGYAGGGGGGASSVGIAANSTSAGNGGNGISSTITGTAVSRAGGGGGTVYNGAIGVGTSGGGSGGTSDLAPFTAPTPGTANTGGGGGGGNDASKGQDGGSGVVILRYKTANVSNFVVTGTLNTPTPSIVGTDSVLIFTTGTGTVTFS